MPKWVGFRYEHYRRGQLFCIRWQFGSAHRKEDLPHKEVVFPTYFFQGGCDRDSCVYVMAVVNYCSTWWTLRCVSSQLTVMSCNHHQSVNKRWPTRFWLTKPKETTLLTLTSGKCHTTIVTIIQVTPDLANPGCGWPCDIIIFQIWQCRWNIVNRSAKTGVCLF